MALDKMLRHSELAAYGAYLILEEKTQRLTELKIHLLGQTTYVVMALDGRAGDRERLDTVGIDGALGEPFHILYLVGLAVKHVDESLCR